MSSMYILIHRLISESECFYLAGSADRVRSKNICGKSWEQAINECSTFRNGTILG